MAMQGLESVWHGTRIPGAPVVVLLHEGLGCVALWRDWPARLAAETGLPVFAYSRRGYGKSQPVSVPRPLRYMQDEGEVELPEVLDHERIDEAILIGHSDGASIAIVHAASEPGRVRSAVLLAPHVFCEEVSVREITRARDAFTSGDLRARLQRYHGDNVDCAFWGWNRAWLDPDFRRWNIESYLPRIDAPLLVIQGEDDPYGTVAQVDAIERGARQVERLMLPDCRHAPHLDRPDETTRAIVDFVGLADTPARRRA
jgi:pimeloyl-ACP methyl ester carboxylesterase